MRWPGPRLGARVPYRVLTPRRERNSPGAASADPLAQARVPLGCRPPPESCLSPPMLLILTSPTYLLVPRPGGLLATLEDDTTTDTRSHSRHWVDRAFRICQSSRRQDFNVGFASHRFKLGPCVCEHAERTPCRQSIDETPSTAAATSSPSAGAAV